MILYFFLKTSWSIARADGTDPVSRHDEPMVAIDALDFALQTFEPAVADPDTFTFLPVKDTIIKILQPLLIARRCVRGRLHLSLGDGDGLWVEVHQLAI